MGKKLVFDEDDILGMTLALRSALRKKGLIRQRTEDSCYYDDDYDDEPIGGCGYTPESTYGGCGSSSRSYGRCGLLPCSIGTC